MASSSTASQSNSLKSNDGQLVAATQSEQALTAQTQILPQDPVGPAVPDQVPAVNPTSIDQTTPARDAAHHLPVVDTPAAAPTSSVDHSKESLELSDLNTGRRGSSSSIRSTHSVQFPVLPATQALPNQTKQTASQVASILSLPTPLLLNLARTASPDEQRAIASKAKASPYLSAMSLPPPSPTESFSGAPHATSTGNHDPALNPTASSFRALANLSSRTDPGGTILPTERPSGSHIPITSIGDHPAIPVLLGQVFAPPTPGIAAPLLAETTSSFEPLYASVEDWSLSAAREQVNGRQQHPGLAKSHSFNEKEVAVVAQQMAQWAIEETEKQVQQQVTTSRETAVLLAAQAAARAAIVSAATTAVSVASAAPNGQLPEGMTQTDVQTAAIVMSGGPNAGAAVEYAVQSMDLSSYAETYKQQLDALASGYFAQLHREALKRILNAADSTGLLHDGSGPETTTSASQFTPADDVSSTTIAGSVPASSAGLSSQSQSSASTPAHSSTATMASSSLPLQSLDGVNKGQLTAPQAQAMHVQAAAAAAVAANVMAAKEMANVAGNALESMGVDVPRLVPDQAVEGLKVLEIRPEAIAVTPPLTSAGSQCSASANAAHLAASIASATEAAAKAADEATAASLPEAAAPAPPNAMPSQSSRSGSGPSPISSSTAATPATQPAEVTAFLQHPSSTQSRTPEKRDYLLSYAHALYTKDPMSAELLPLLHTLEQAHEDHLPTLLLMSCVYYTRGELESSFYYNKRLLSKDPNYVEAMSNIGTTLRAMGKWREAETWWFKAIRLRPTYWDATENLLGVLCNPATTLSAAAAPLAAHDPPPTTPRYREALALCDFVEAQVFASTIPQKKRLDFGTFSNPAGAIPRPLELPASIPINHVHRLENLFYAKGNLRIALGDAAAGQDEYEKAVEIALSVPAWVRQRVPADALPPTGMSVRTLVIATVILGKLFNAYSIAGTSETAQAQAYRAAAQYGVGDGQGGVMFHRLCLTVQQDSEAYMRSLLAEGHGVLPTVLLQPEALAQLPTLLLPQTHGFLPALYDPTVPSNVEIDPTRKSAIESVNQTTSTMLLTLAKIFQDSINAAGSVPLTMAGISASQSLLLPLYYVALALYPSPSTCNNLGILLSTMNATTYVGSGQQQGVPPVVVTAQQLALRYYEAGLKLDPRHPHLYTNLGSLLKDMGQLPQAVEMYKKAVSFNPTFDVALANLANAVKDMGQIQESIPFYRRAVALNPNFPEAVCGLINALGGVCDWRGRGGVVEEWVVNEQNELVPATSLARPTRDQPMKVGYMGQISDLVSKQLQDGLGYGAGTMRSLGSTDDWLVAIMQAIYNRKPQDLPQVAATWARRLQFVLSDLSLEQRKKYCINEGGFLIRLIERVTRRTQRRWYLDVYGPILGLPDESVNRIVPSRDDMDKYRRIIVPPSLPICPVPTVLPFHCFTLSVTPRETRLISHRTGLRISHSTLNQPWLAPMVYPPPRPPLGGKINVGYVSSDLGNHPLSHLMQSIFGMHDLAHFNVFCYATSPSDRSSYRLKIEAEAQHFLDVSTASTQQIVDQILQDEIHVLINLSGYTKGARNEVFAARPAPVQMSYMGFAGTLSAGWCDYFIVDPIVCPPNLVSGNLWRHRQSSASSAPQQPGHVDTPTDLEGDLDPESLREDFVYAEKLMYMPHSYFVTDHKQAWREDPAMSLHQGEVSIKDDGSPERRWAIEEDKRWKMRKQLFPHLRDDTFIFANWNQLYKIDPFIFRSWLNILQKHENSILWLLRFPAAGEAHLKETALKWAGKSVADRVIFTDVANKNDHIHRGRVADLFLDTTECNAHTTAADILWSGTPLLTYPRHQHKMASRVAASIAVATGLGPEMIVSTAADYERRALELARGLTYEMLPPLKVPADLPEARAQRRGKGELSRMRQKLFLTRDTSPLFDTKRWVQNLERGLKEAWRRWVTGIEFEDFEADRTELETRTGCIWVRDPDDLEQDRRRQPYIS